MHSNQHNQDANPSAVPVIHLLSDCTAEEVLDTSCSVYQYYRHCNSIAGRDINLRQMMAPVETGESNSPDSPRCSFPNREKKKIESWNFFRIPTANSASRSVNRTTTCSLRTYIFAQSISIVLFSPSISLVIFFFPNKEISSNKTEKSAEKKTVLLLWTLISTVRITKGIILNFYI